MKNLQLLIIVTGLICLNSITMKAQSFDWATSIGSISIDSVYSIITDGNGDVYITGSFAGQMDFDPGVSTLTVSPAGIRDAFVQKLDNQGNMLWTVTFGDTGLDEGYSLAIDGSGNIVIKGVFQGTVDFDPGSGVVNLTAVSSSDHFVMKLDPNGNLIWAVSLEKTHPWDLINEQTIAVDANNNIYLCGMYIGITDLDPGPGVFNLTGSNTSTFVLKLDANGIFIWAKSIDGAFCNALNLNPSGQPLVAGSYNNTTDFDPGPSTQNLTPIGDIGLFLLQLDANGGLLSINTLEGGNWYTALNKVTFDNGGNLFVTGCFGGTIDFDPSVGVNNLTSLNENEIFILKLDASGNFSWVQQIKVNYYIAHTSISIDGTGNCYISGQFAGTSDFDPSAGVFNLITLGNDNPYILKLDPTGSFLWAKQVACTGSSIGKSITTDLNGNVFLTGNYANVADLNPDALVNNYASNGGADIFVIKLGSTVGVIDLGSGNEFSIYPNPTSNQLIISKADFSINSVAIIDITGKTVKTIVSKSKTINVADLPKGIYFIQINAAENRIIKKFIKN